MKWKRKQRNHYHNSERRKYEISILQALWNILIWNREQSYLLCCQMQESDLTSNHNYFGVFLCINYTISQHLRQSKFRPQSLNDKRIKM